MAKREVDWAGVEREYRAGQLSLAEIERKYKVSDTAIIKKAKKHGWKRDLAAQVRKKTMDKLVVGDAVGATSAEEIVDMAAERATAVVTVHRADINKGREIVRTLFNELNELNKPEVLELVEDSIHEETKNDINTKRRHTMLRAVSLPSRAGVIKALASALRDLVPLERQAFNLDPKNTDPKTPEDHVPVEERVKRFTAKNVDTTESNVVPIRKTT